MTQLFKMIVLRRRTVIEVTGNHKICAYTKKLFFFFFVCLKIEKNEIGKRKIMNKGALNFMNLESTKEGERNIILRLGEEIFFYDRLE